MNHNPYSVGEESNHSAAGPGAPKLEAWVRAMQIIATVLMMGVLVFFGVVLIITQGKIGGMENAAGLTMVGAGFGFVMIVSHFTIPGIICGTQMKQAAADGSLNQQDDATTQRIWGLYQTQLIVGLALLEGAAFFNLIALMVENSVASLGVVILLLGLMAVKFPTRNKVSWWVEDKLRECW